MNSVERQMLIAFFNDLVAAIGEAADAFRQERTPKAAGCREKALERLIELRGGARVHLFSLQKTELASQCQEGSAA